MNRHTSPSPIQIAALPLPRTRGLLGLTVCPGKRESESEHRSMDADMAAIANWPAHAVVTLLENPELDLLNVQSLGESIREHGMEWIHFEIADGMAPDQRFESAWPGVFPRLQALLCEGRNVVVHCRGGSGRTGTVAALILKEFGVATDDAIRQVRSVRPGAIQSPEQEAYVKDYCPLSSRI